MDCRGGKLSSGAGPFASRRRPDNLGRARLGRILARGQDDRARVILKSLK
jgi:hypothetical protein